MAGENLLEMNLRKALNLVAYSILEKAEGEGYTQLHNLFRGDITYEEFHAWAEALQSNSANEDGSIDIKKPLKKQWDELAEIRKQLDGRNKR